MRLIFLFLQHVAHSPRPGYPASPRGGTTHSILRRPRVRNAAIPSEATRLSCSMAAPFRGAPNPGCSPANADPSNARTRTEACVHWPPVTNRPPRVYTCEARHTATRHAMSLNCEAVPHGSTTSCRGRGIVGLQSRRETPQCQWQRWLAHQTGRAPTPHIHKARA